MECLDVDETTNIKHLSIPSVSRSANST